MTSAETIGGASQRLLKLVGCVHRQTGFAAVVASLQSGDAATIDGAWGSGCALTAAAVGESSPGPLVVVLSTVERVDDFVDDLQLFTTLPVAVFAAWESLSGEDFLHNETAGERVRLLKMLQGQGGQSHFCGILPQKSGQSPGRPPRIIVTSIQALMQPVPDPAALARQTRSLHVGDEIDEAQLAGWLVEAGFHATPAVELPGEFSLRGGIVDVFAADWNDPVRVEFFGDRIESIRAFDVAGQRSLLRLEGIDVTALDRGAAGGAHLADYLPRMPGLG